MTRTARVRAPPKSLATLVATAISVPVRGAAALPGLAVACTLSNRGLGVPWRIASVAISIPLLIRGGSAANPQALTVALRMSVPVVRKLLVMRSRVAAGPGGDRIRAAVLALVWAWLRCQNRTRRSRFCPRLKQRH